MNKLQFAAMLALIYVGTGLLTTLIAFVDEKSKPEDRSPEWFISTVDLGGKVILLAGIAALMIIAFLSLFRWLNRQAEHAFKVRLFPYPRRVQTEAGPRSRRSAGAD